MPRLPVLLLALAPLSTASAQEAPGGEPFHARWSAVLSRFVDERGRVDYAALAKDRGDLDAYLGRLAKEGPRSTPAAVPGRSERLAYYLNAYNALVFDGVLRRGPEKESVWKGGLISGYSFFVGTKHRLDGADVSLKALEDETIRKGFSDPRVHAALNCASRGCPRLPREAFDPATLDAALDAAMTEFVSEERNVRVDSAARTVFLSKIFDWFERDFLDFERARRTKDGSLLSYVNLYRKGVPPLDPAFRVKFLEYDKGVNAR